MDRAVSPVVAVLVLLGVTAVAAVGVTTAGMSVDVGSERTAAGPTIAVSAEADTQQIAVVHRGGGAMDLRNCSLTIRVDGEPLRHQPPVPYFAAAGFSGTPTGPFNSGGETVFDPGERATLQLASTNAPHVATGDRVTVTIRRDGRRLAAASVRAS